MAGSREIFQERNSDNIQQATLCLLKKKDKDETLILLGMKKRGFGANLWNGLGGKVKKEEIVDAARREAYEESGVTVNSMKKVAVLHFYFPDDPKRKEWNQDVHVFIVDDWEGQPEESEEMKPQWFRIDDIPYKQMWDDDEVWLPKVLDGKRVVGYFAFDFDNKMIEHKITEVDDFK
jgi:8-oxo-dGTP diphosphatase/2-hydroxy-dATP diphosphatase